MLAALPGEPLVREPPSLALFDQRLDDAIYASDQQVRRGEKIEVVKPGCREETFSGVTAPVGHEDGLDQGLELQPLEPGAGLPRTQSTSAVTAAGENPVG